MRRLGRLLAAAMATAPLVAGVGYADGEASPLENSGAERHDALEFFRGWMLEGTNTARYDHYGEKGPDGPYPDEGAMFYDEVDISFRKQDGPYSQWRSQFSLLLNDNDYRSIDKGVVPERLNLTREVGDRSVGGLVVPYRWELGDYFSYTSYMSQQLAGKGLQFELQPGFMGHADSLVFFGGTNETRWQELAFNEDASVGASYLHQLPGVGELSFNTVYNFTESVAPEGALEDFDQDQVVISSTYANDFVWFDHKVNVQAEHAFFVGDHGSTIETSAGKNRFGVGTFAEMRGQHPTLPLDYRVRGERYDEDFRPRGAVVTGDRQSGEAHVGWRFMSGLRIRGRFQGFQDGFQTANQTSTTLGGMNLSGPMFGRYLPQVTGTVDVLGRRIRNKDRTVNTNAFNLNAEFGRPICEDWYGRFGFFTNVTNDRTLGDADQNTYQLTFSTDHTREIGPFQALITPGMVFRFLRKGSDAAASDGDEFNPTLALRLSKQDHSIGFNYGTMAQNRSDEMSTDIAQHTLSADYRYDRGRNSFGAEFNYFGQRPEDETDTDAWRVGLYWTLNFDNKRSRPAAAPTPGADIPSPFGGELDEVDIAKLSPGLPYLPTRNRLAALGVTGGSRFGDYEVYDFQVFPRLNQRQRLVLVRTPERIIASAVIVNFDSTLNGDTARQSFERVRKAMIDRYGKPVRINEEGDFKGDVVAKINSQELIRTSEWDTPSGVIRLGIPRRLDGQVRMEIQHRSRFASQRNTLWSVEAVR